VSLQAEDAAARLAQYLEGRGQAEMAADVWVNASEAERAIGLYAQVRGQCVAIVLTGRLLADSCKAAAQSRQLTCCVVAAAWQRSRS
jgi:hypothetical protein